MSKAKKTIGIDARFYGPIGKGLGRYTQEIVDYVVANDKANDYVIFLSRHNFANFVADGKRVRKVLADLAWYSLSEQLIFPSLIKKYRVSLMHFPHFNVPVYCPVPFVVTIHDLILTKYPTVRASTLGPVLYYLKNQAYRLVIWRAIKRARQIITVSEFTKQDIVDYFKISPEKITVTYEGVAELSTQSLAETSLVQEKQALKITKPYLLYVGNAYPHKNLEWLLRVLKSALGRYDLQLVLVGKMDYFYQRLSTMTAKWSKADRERVIFAGFVPDALLNELYAEAKAYVFPSLYEGFGLPPLEAMAQACPVLASNSSSMPEILGQAALYFDPSKDEELLLQLKRLMNDQKLAQKLGVFGVKRAKLYSWKNCGQATLKIYKQYVV
jgi:glycosyltransferase involved in cell wall biosynthesis